MKYKNLDVLVLTYNRANYLKIMLESLCTQTATGFSIKVLNNCSTDNTIEIVNAIKSKYPERKIEIITHKKNLGNFGNFKYSQKIASNEYVAVFHDDDAIHPEYIETAMTILLKDPSVVMCSGNLVGMWSVSNDNWDILYKDYDLYPKNDGVYLNLLINRPTFASNIYRTKYYKKIQYRPERYGKLHDIVFMMEMNRLGSVAFIQGQCIRWRQSTFNDSHTFSNGPFPNEIANIINDINNLNKEHRFLNKMLLWDFTHFLYKWSLLNKYETWKKFITRLTIHDTKQGVFSPFEIKCLNSKLYQRCMHSFARKRWRHYKRQIYRHYDGRF